LAPEGGIDDDDVYYYINERLIKLEGETEKLL
jgi:hypothetical protein